MTKKFTEKNFQDAQKKLFQIKIINDKKQKLIKKLDKRISKIREGRNTQIIIPKNLAIPKKFLDELVKENINEKTDVKIKLNALNSIIGYLVRKGADSNLPMEILINIANDYEKRLNELETK